MNDRDVEHLRLQLNKAGKQKLDEFISLVGTISKDTIKDNVIKKAERLLRKYPLTPIRFINFEDFERFGSCPRFPLCRTRNLEAIDRDNSLLIFISHCWLRGHYDKNNRPHPDNATGDKFKLCVNGLRMIKERYAPAMKNFYIWMDYSCMNQDKQNLADDLKRYDKIVECCDAIFTPVVDPNHKKWSYDTTASDGVFVDYKAKLWSVGPHAYLNRAWCRAEMMYATAIPILENTDTSVKRHTKFEAGLAARCRDNKRAHILYGTKEDESGYKLFFLPPLDFSYFQRYNPLKGMLSKESDRIHVANLIADLQKYNANLVPGYSGQQNDAGQPHGKGSLIRNSGIQVEGDWSNGVINGACKIRYETEEYSGDWKDGAQHGKGRYKFPDGSVYEGDWVKGAMEGQGEMLYADGARYEGEWRSDSMHGQGTMLYENGTTYEGVWREGAKNGQGVLKDALDGSVYEGEWKHDMMHGQGRMVWDNGDTYSGGWKKGCFDGYGVMKYADGDVQEGIWRKGDLMEISRHSASSRHKKGQFR